eukprot:Selendium_serpulae@DN3863_c0_g1_i2.p1
MDFHRDSHTDSSHYDPHSISHRDSHTDSSHHDPHSHRDSHRDSLDRTYDSVVTDHHEPELVHPIGHPSRSRDRMMDTTADTDIFARAAKPGGDVGDPESETSFTEFDKKMSEFMADLGSSKKEGIFANNDADATRDLT